jgi:O-antigen/teichoic acid export membrane protein
MATELLPEPQPETTGGRVAKNASIYFVGQTFSWLANIIVLSIIPRTLGEAAMGQFAYVMGIIMMLALCAQMGGEMFLTIEVGRNPGSSKHFVEAMLGLRIALIPVYVLACLLFFKFSKGVDATMWMMVWILTVAGILALVSDPLRAVMVAWEDSKRVSFFDLVFTLFPLLTLPFLRYGIITQAVIFLLSSLTVFFLRFRVVGRAMSLRPRYEPALWKHLLIKGFPYQANILVLQVYNLTSVLMLKHFGDYTALGVFSQAQRLFGAFLFVPNALSMALLPSLARMADAGTSEFRQTQSRVLVLLLVISLPVMTAIIFFSEPISHFLYGTTKYVDMPLVLKVYALAIAPIYIVSTMYQFLVAQGRGAVWTGFLITSVGLFVVFAALLIPYTLRVYQSGATGGAGAIFLAELCSTGFALALLGNNPFRGKMLRRIIAALLATGGMGAALWLTRSVFPLLSFALGILVFAILAWILRVLLPEEQERMRMLLRRLRRAG